MRAARAPGVGLACAGCARGLAQTRSAARTVGGAPTIAIHTGGMDGGINVGCRVGVRCCVALGVYSVFVGKCLKANHESKVSRVYSCELFEDTVTDGGWGGAAAWGGLEGSIIRESTSIKKYPAPLVLTVILRGNV